MNIFEDVDDDDEDGVCACVCVPVHPHGAKHFAKIERGRERERANTCPQRCA